MANYPTRHESITDAQEQDLFTQMKMSQQMFDRAINGMSGADQTDSEMHAIDRRIYQAVWSGGYEALEPVLLDGAARWVAYAAEINARVAAAPKTKRGPYSGQSSAHYRWASPDKFSPMHANHLRFMVRKILGIAESKEG